MLKIDSCYHGMIVPTVQMHFVNVNNLIKYHFTFYCILKVWNLINMNIYIWLINKQIK